MQGYNNIIIESYLETNHDRSNQTLCMRPTGSNRVQCGPPWKMFAQPCLVANTV